jgi:hypothetical protein
MNNLDRDQLIYMAKVCEQSERFEDMLLYMKEVLKLGVSLNAEERNLLSVAYKNFVGVPRSAWRVLQSLEEKEKKDVKDRSEEPDRQTRLNLLKQCKKDTEIELSNICKEIIQSIDNVCLKKADENGEKDAKVFFLKMKGDYYRYIAEYIPDEEKAAVSEKAFKSYEDAYNLAKEELKTTNPIRLGLALNYSVFYYEIKENSKKACEIAKTAFDDAIADIENIDEAHYKDSTTIMQLMRDNLTLWTSEMADVEDEDDN